MAKKSKELEGTKYVDSLVAGWSEEKVAGFQSDFLEWYYQEKRQLPWRETTNPYSIWVSEIMLQQTQVQTVIPYFQRFMEWFPTIKDLAEAPEDRLLKAWEGLGYYSRVRNMQVAAQQIEEKFKGEMPKTLGEISELKGIGPYTAGAISSIAFGLPEPAIDGNVMRVFSRLFEIKEDITKPASRKIFDFVVRKLMSHDDPSSFNQAIMDLGATICTPVAPKCDACPLILYCQAEKSGTMVDYPVKTKKVKAKPVFYLAQVIQNESGDFMLNQRGSSGLLANFWTFPLIEIDEVSYHKLKKSWLQFEEENSTQLTLDEVSEDSYDISSWMKDVLVDSVVWQKQPIGEITHVFSHLKWHVLVTYGAVKGATYELKENERWLKPSEFDNYAFPKPQQKMVELLEGKDYL